jgi:hypothetical protein
MFQCEYFSQWHQDAKGNGGSTLQEVIYGGSKERRLSCPDVQERGASDCNELGFHKK